MITLVLAAVALMLGGCAVPITGTALAAPEVSAGIDPGFIRGSDGGTDDRLAAATLHDLEGFWTDTFPTLAPGRGFTPLRGYYSVDSSRPGPSPPCLNGPQQIQGNAFYCPRADIIAYDRAALLPVLRQQFGDSAVVVVVAHEFGHSIQKRLDNSAAGGPGEDGSVPTILLEGQADCLAGVFLRAVHDARTPDLRTGDAGIDAAMKALVNFRDPVGTGPSDDSAHGNGFDRATSFQLGYEGTASTCTGMRIDNRLFTQRSFTSLQDQSTGGNLPVEELIRTMAPDLDRFFSGVVASKGGRWSPATVTPGAATCPTPGSGTAGARSGAETQGPIAFCSTDRTVRIDNGPALTAQHRRIGDYATGTLLASRYGMAALAALNRPTTGRDAGRTALCLGGAYTGAVGQPGSQFGLSPGDLDEAVETLLSSPDPIRDTTGASGAGTGYDRVRVFRAGVTGGANACLDHPV